MRLEDPGCWKDWKQSPLRVTSPTLPYLGKKERARPAWLFSAANADGFALAFGGDGCAGCYSLEVICWGRRSSPAH